MANAKETIKQIRELDTVESIKALIEGETRSTVLEVASKKIAKISENSGNYFDDVQPVKEEEKVHGWGSSLGHVHDVK